MDSEGMQLYSREKKGANVTRIAVITLSCLFLLLILIAGFLFYQSQRKLVNMSTAQDIKLNSPYNASFAEQTITNSLFANIKDTYLPHTIEIKQGLNTANVTSDTDYTFGVLWHYNENIDIRDIFHYVLGTNTMRDNQIFISEGGNLPADKQIMATNFQKFFKSAPTDLASKLKCSPSNNKLCEYFTTWPDGMKRGMSIYVGRQIQGVTYTLYLLCEIPKESAFYTWNSCYQQYEAQGIAK